MGSTNDSSANITLPTSVWVTDTLGVRKYLDAPSDVTAAAFGDDCISNSRQMHQGQFAGGFLCTRSIVATQCEL